MSRQNNRIRRRRLNLMAQDPHCWWCGRLVLDYGDHHFVKGEEIPDDVATIDHLNQQNRQEGPRPEQGLCVLACYPCNQKRSREWSQQIQGLTTVCQECGKMGRGRFCSAECWVLNKTRKEETVQLTYAERQHMEKLMARHRAKKRRRNQRSRERLKRRKLSALVAVEPVLAVEAVPAPGAVVPDDVVMSVEPVGSVVG